MCVSLASFGWLRELGVRQLFPEAEVVTGSHELTEDQLCFDLSIEKLHVKLSSYVSKLLNERVL